MPDLERQKYSPDLGIGLLCSSAVLGIIIPPSIIMIVCALTAGESVIRLFAAGYLPGLIIVFTLSIYAFFRAKTSFSLRHIKETETMPSFTKAFFRASLPILLVVLLFAGIYSGAFTVTEASVVSCVFAIIIECFIYRSTSLKSFIEILKNSFLVSGALVITVSGAGVISEYITIRQIPEQIMAVAMEYIPNKYVYLFFVNILLLIVGTFIDPIGAIMILVPILVPIATQFGIDQTHICLVITIALGIGYLTPPLGLLLYTACAITKREFIYVVKAVMPSLVIFIMTLLMISYFPIVSTIVPDLLLGKK
jgi:C4-dicarboxylate transporter DctM subunit